MSLLSQVSKPANNWRFFTIYGGAGVGKTSLAATFPKPIFIRLEDGMQSIPFDLRPDAFPLAHSFNDVSEQIMALLNENHDYKTVVFDSITKLNRILIEEIVKGSSKSSSNVFDNKALAKAGGGYGAGYQILANYHQRIRNACQMLADKKGMNVVFIGHADVETVDLPDSTPFQRFSLKMEKQAQPHYVDDVDFVGFLRLETYILSDESKKAKATSDGTRILQCTTNASSISKNRMGITQDIHIQHGVNPLINFLTKE